MNDLIFTNKFDEFFDDFLGFGRPKRLAFNSLVKDMSPSIWTKKDNNTYMCIVKTLGVEPTDINVEETNNGIKVHGESEIEGFKYNTSMILPISQDIMNEIEKIEVKSKNGLTFITLKLDRPEKKKINIEKID